MSPINTDLPTLQAALGYLMTRYARTGSDQVAQAVIDHLTMILAHPNVHPDSCTSKTYKALLRQWHELQPRACAQPVRARAGGVLH